MLPICHGTSLDGYVKVRSRKLVLHFFKIINTDKINQNKNSILNTFYSLILHNLIFMIVYILFKDFECIQGLYKFKIQFGK